MYKVGNNCSIAESAIIENDCIIGNDVVIHDYVVLKKGTIIGDGTEIFESTVIGRFPRGTEIIISKIPTVLEPVVIGCGCVIGATTVIYAGCKIGNKVLIGDGCKMRECADIGDRVLLAANVTLNHHVTIKGNCKVLDLTHLTSRTVVEENVFIGPGVMSANDNAMQISGNPVNTQIVFHSGAKVGAGAVILPVTHIGRDSIVAAQSVVTKNVPDAAKVVGVPARVIS